MDRAELRTLGTLDLRVGGRPSPEVAARSKHVALLWSPLDDPRFQRLVERGPDGD